MRVLIVGGGGREHALAWGLKRSPSVDLVATCPGNPGTAALGPTHPTPSRQEELVQLARNLESDLVVVGPEAPLVAGLADSLRQAGIDVFGPSAAAARLEGSKVFAKQFMEGCGIPTARFGVFDDAERAHDFVRHSEVALVVKAEGLAAGKGVLVPSTEDETHRAVDRVLVERAFGEAGARVVLEERLSGPELSLMAVADGRNWLCLTPSRDHKRLLEGDAGPNTGGMGAIAPVGGIGASELSDLERRVIEAALRGMEDLGTPFVGCLYAGLMLTADGPRVLEYNVRFGDPEAQALLPLVEGDLGLLLRSAARGALEADTVRLVEGAAASVVLAAPGYPAEPRRGLEIGGVDDLPEKVVAFHAGTARRADGALVTAGGRVLALTALGDDLQGALETTYAAIERVHFEGMQFRADIGRGEVNR